jgi:itaconate CoA-transferase
LTPPLQGITVVSIEQAVSAPFATRQLADLGARVIKIERPDGGDFARGYDTTVGGLSSYFVWLNRSKESLTLDLKQPAAQTVLAQLLERADVFVQNLAPGAADRLGAATADLRARHPRLITCAVSGYGSAGPYVQKKAYDMLIQAEAGLLSVTGTPETPSRVGISVADIAAGMYAYSGILTALLARATTGAGAALEVSLFDALAEWMGAPAYYTSYGGSEPARSGASHATIAPYELFVSADEGEIYLAIQNAREWSRFCEQVLARPEVAEDPRFTTNSLRVQHRADLHALIAGVFAQLSSTAILDRLERADIACARRNSVEEFINHPQLTERHSWRTVDSPIGPVRALRPPVRMEGVDPVMGRIPSLGQHSQPILEELGFDAGTIAAWRKEQMI